MELSLINRGELAQTSPAKKLMTQNLQLAGGHQGQIYCAKFSPCGDFLASAGHDKLINVWDVFHPSVQSLGFCKGHKNAILDLVWDHGVEASSNQPPRLHSCSADKTLSTWNTVDFSRIRCFKGHEDVVNSLDVSYLPDSALSAKIDMQQEDQDMSSSAGAAGLQCDMLVSGSNDGTVKVWDFRERRYSASFTVGW